MSTKRVLVTGATGFLGSHLARHLCDRGDEVRALVRHTSNRSRLEGLDLAQISGDVTDRPSVEDALKDIDLVVHCAAAVEFGPNDASVVEKVNVRGTEHVLGAAAERGIASVYVSSLAALGHTPVGEEPKDESWWSGDPSVTVYEGTKRRAHLFARSLVDKGAPIRIAMPGGIYGFGDLSTMATVIKIYALAPVPLGYVPEVRHSVVNVDDCADALVRIADDGVDGDEYLIVSDCVSVREWLVAIAAGAGHRPPALYLPTSWIRALAAPTAIAASAFGVSASMVREAIAAASSDSAYTSAKLRNELGWSPRPLRQGMAEMVASIQDAADRARRDRRIARAAQRSTRI